MKFEHNGVSNSEMRHFLQDQGKQGVGRPASRREEPAPQFDAARPVVALAKTEDCEKGPFPDGNQLEEL